MRTPRKKPSEAWMLIGELPVEEQKITTTEEVQDIIRLGKRLERME